MGELNLDCIEREAAPAVGYMAGVSLLAEHPPGIVLSVDDFHQLQQTLETCSGADDSCKSCVHAALCRQAYDELVKRLR